MPAGIGVARSDVVPAANGARPVPLAIDETYEDGVVRRMFADGSGWITHLRTLRGVYFTADAVFSGRQLREHSRVRFQMDANFRAIDVR
jgi:hypothetical protein